MYPANGRERWALLGPFYRLSDELVKLDSFAKHLWEKGDQAWPASRQSMVLGSSWSLSCMASHSGLLGVGF